MIEVDHLSFQDEAKIENKEDKITKHSSSKNEAIALSNESDGK